jgi:hypothetical protein
LSIRARSHAPDRSHLQHVHLERFDGRPEVRHHKLTVRHQEIPYPMINRHWIFSKMKIHYPICGSEIDMSNIYHAPPTRESRYRARPGLRAAPKKDQGALAVQSALLTWASALAVIAVILLSIIAIRWSVSGVP